MVLKISYHEARNSLVKRWKLPTVKRETPHMRLKRLLHKSRNSLHVVRNSPQKLETFYVNGGNFLL